MKQPPEEKRPTLDRFDLLASSDTADTTAGHVIGSAIAAGHVYARGLQILPGNICTPTFLAERAEELARSHGFQITVLDRAAMEKEGMGALLAVAQGARRSRASSPSNTRAPRMRPWCWSVKA